MIKTHLELNPMVLNLKQTAKSKITPKYTVTTVWYHRQSDVGCNVSSHFRSAPAINQKVVLFFAVCVCVPKENWKNNLPMKWSWLMPSVSPTNRRRPKTEESGWVESWVCTESRSAFVSRISAIAGGVRETLSSEVCATCRAKITNTCCVWWWVAFYGCAPYDEGLLAAEIARAANMICRWVHWRGFVWVCVCTTAGTPALTFSLGAVLFPELFCFRSLSSSSGKLKQKALLIPLLKLEYIYWLERSFWP